MQGLAREQNFNKAEEYLFGPFQLTIFNDLLQEAPLLPWSSSTIQRFAS